MKGPPGNWRYERVQANEVRMKTLGLIGGTSWLSTIDYYRLINQMIAKRLGGLNSAQIYMYSLNLSQLSQMSAAGDWAGVAAWLSSEARKLEQAGAQALLICANTPHKVADQVQAAIGIPLIHIADATAAELRKLGLSQVGLLGTRFTMEDDFIKGRLGHNGITCIIPDEPERTFVHDSIYQELGRGVFSTPTKERYKKIIGQLAARGAQGVILGCTEIPILIKPEDAPVPLIDTTVVHARAAVEFVLGAA